MEVGNEEDRRNHQRRELLRVVRVSGREIGGHLGKGREEGRKGEVGYGGGTYAIIWWGLY